MLGEATGTNTCRPGIANVWPTLHDFQESIVANVLAGPSGWPTVLNCCTVTVLPTVPWILLKKLLRSGVQPS